MNLELNPLEVNDTQESVLSNFGLMGVGLVSVVVAARVRNAYLAGLTYPVLIPLAEAAIGARMGIRRRRLEAQIDAEEA